MTRRFGASTGQRRRPTNQRGDAVWHCPPCRAHGRTSAEEKNGQILIVTFDFALCGVHNEDLAATLAESLVYGIAAMSLWFSRYSSHRDPLPGQECDAASLTVGMMSFATPSSLKARIQRSRDSLSGLVTMYMPRAWSPPGMRSRNISMWGALPDISSAEGSPLTRG